MAAFLFYVKFPSRIKVKKLAKRLSIVFVVGYLLLNVFAPRQAWPHSRSVILLIFN